MHKKQSRESGHVLALVACIVVIVTLMSLSMLSISLNSRTLAIRTTQKIQARCAADAGLTKGLFEMNEKLKVKKWDDSSLPSSTDETLPNVDAVFSYKITRAADYKDMGSIGFKLASGATNRYIIASVGKAGIAQKQVYGQFGLKGLFDHAVLAKNSQVLKSDTLVDGYNSLDATDTDVDVKVGTLSTLPEQVVLNSNVVVNGDVFVGVDGDVNTVIRDEGATTGARYAMLEEPPLPTITPPVLPDIGTDIIVDGATITLGPADSGKYEDIDISGNGILEISGGEVTIHITGDIELDNGCEIIVKDGASLILYADGDVLCRNGSSIGLEGAPQQPQNLQIYSTSTGAEARTFDLKAKSNWSGVVYAPNVYVVLRAQADVYGSFVAKDFEFKNGGNMYYDKALRTVSTDDEGVRFVMQRWSER
ncbi:hypothetical protein ACFL02_05010 [Planctomycetota bacterium]